MESWFTVLLATVLSLLDWLFGLDFDTLPDFKVEIFPNLFVSRFRSASIVCWFRFQTHRAWQ